jgi:UDP-N-acetylmuramoyl-tripeptide--D-alanyl-D-alanine ligase
MVLAASALLLLAALAGSVRWLRVAQREHYIPGSVTRFWWRWIWSSALNTVVWVALVAECLVGIWFTPILFFAAAFVVQWPIGLPVRGRTGKLAWTRRLRTVAGVSALAAAALTVAVAIPFGIAPAAALLAVAVPFTIDAALLLTAPLESRLADRHLRAASAKLARIKPIVVAITGSYGKTSTKEHLRDLLAGALEVVASPASFNNKAGLSRAINERMGPSCEVFIAEMGTYGPGEIRELCRSIPPAVAVITAIGPVHLERMGSLEAITAAKAEILERATTAVLNVDSPHLAGLAAEVRPRMTVLRCGSDGDDLDVRVVTKGADFEVHAAGTECVVPRPEGVQAVNVSCALGAALALGVSLDRVVERIAKLAPPPHRAQEELTPSGVLVIDDTYNANPEGARHALQELASAEVAGSRVLVTPGLIELGRAQDAENRQLARLAAGIVDDLIIVNATNRAALRTGAREGGVEPVELRDREQAVGWVREHLRAGDAVLYENDLPDHYP